MNPLFMSDGDGEPSVLFWGEIDGYCGLGADGVIPEDEPMSFNNSASIPIRPEDEPMSFNNSASIPIRPEDEPMSFNNSASIERPVGGSGPVDILSDQWMRPEPGVQGGEGWVDLNPATGDVDFGGETVSVSEFNPTRREWDEVAVNVTKVGPEEPGPTIYVATGTYADYGPGGASSTCTSWTEDPDSLERLGFNSLDELICSNEKKKIVREVLSILDAMTTPPDFSDPDISDALKLIQEVHPLGSLLDLMRAHIRLGQGDVGGYVLNFIDSFPGVGGALAGFVGGMGWFNNARLPSNVHKRLLEGIDESLKYVASGLSFAGPPGAAMAFLISLQRALIYFGQARFDMATETAVTAVGSAAFAASGISDAITQSDKYKKLTANVVVKMKSRFPALRKLTGDKVPSQSMDVTS